MTLMRGVTVPDDLYRHDALLWAEQQAVLLRRLAAGEGVNDMVDWPNVIEELQDVGLSELRSCRSLLLQAMIHLLNRHAWPSGQSAPQSRDEAGVFLDDAEQRFTPSMRQRIELNNLYGRALRRAREATDDAGIPNPLPGTCPFALDELLAGNIAELLAKLAAAI